MTLPNFQSTTFTDRHILESVVGLELAPQTLIDGTNSSDATNTPTWRVRPGMVLGLDISAGLWLNADHASVDVSAPASISSSSHTDGNGVIKLVGPGGTISVTTTTGTGTEANNATDLNADANFAAHYIATSGGGELTITAIDPFADFYVHSDTMATAAFAEGIANKVQGVPGDYRVVADFVDLQDVDGNAVNGPVRAYARGHFDESNLINLTPDAKLVLSKRGSRWA